MSLKAVLRFCAALLLTTGFVSVTTPAQAAVPEAWGFAYVDMTATPPVARQAGSWPSGFGVAVGTGTSPGEVRVAFPQIAVPGGVVHVTAVSPGPEWCMVKSWGPVGPDVVVTVRCHRFPGDPALVPFTVVFQRSGEVFSGPGMLGYVVYDDGSVTSSFNSRGSANTVTRVSTGSWRVTLPDLGASSPGGNIQVTALHPGLPARCKVGGWSPSLYAQEINVLCFVANTPSDTGWTLTYHHERAITGVPRETTPWRQFAYTFDTNPTNPLYAPTPPGINHNSMTATNVIREATPPFRKTTFPLVGGTPDNVQVTAFGTDRPLLSTSEAVVDTVFIP